MKKIGLFLCMLAALTAVSCNKEEPVTDIVTTHNSALIVIPPDGPETVYDIQSAYRHGETLQITSAQAAFCDYNFFFLQDDSVHPVTSYPYYPGTYSPPVSQMPGGELPIVTIYGRYKLTDAETKYSYYRYRFEQTLIQRIIIRGLESFGLGAELSIRVQDGVFSGDNKLIDFVKVNSYVPPTYVIGARKEELPCDSNINIYIRCKSGTIISFRFINKSIPWA
ncbi:MAG: hypothetical protein IJU63_07430 [Bacteroidales bacterium]|nr:hypothetical protein [Bacteroidales bacterium]